MKFQKWKAFGVSLRSSGIFGNFKPFATYMREFSQKLEHHHKSNKPILYHQHFYNLSDKQIIAYVSETQSCDKNMRR